MPELVNLLQPLSIGLVQSIPVAYKGARMFRVRRIDQKPTNMRMVGAPPDGVAAIGRVNENGQSVLYLSDSPATACAESMVTAGVCCLSEWRVNVERLGMANGGISPSMMLEKFPHHVNDVAISKPSEEDELILELFRTLFTLNVGDDRVGYEWSIACALANGFNHQCERTSSVFKDGITSWKGRYPLAAIAYPSVRQDKLALNFAFNDFGRQHVSLHSIQWVERLENGRINGIDFADSWANDGSIGWKNRPAKFTLKQGQTAVLTCIAENTWVFETVDGSLPWYT